MKKTGPRRHTRHPAWIDRHRKGRTMYQMRFSALMRDKSLTLEDLSVIVRYSTSGVMAMVTRGTIKEKTLERLRNRFSDIDDYRKKGASKVGTD